MRDFAGRALMVMASMQTIFGSWHHWHKDFPHAAADFTLAILLMICADTLRPTPRTDG